MGRAGRCPSAPCPVGSGLRPGVESPSRGPHAEPEAFTRDAGCSGSACVRWVSLPPPRLGAGPCVCPCPCQPLTGLSPSRPRSTLGVAGSLLLILSESTEHQGPGSLSGWAGQRGEREGLCPPGLTLCSLRSSLRRRGSEGGGGLTLRPGNLQGQMTAGISIRTPC